MSFRTGKKDQTGRGAFKAASSLVGPRRWLVRPQRWIGAIRAITEVPIDRKFSVLGLLLRFCNNYKPMTGMNRLKGTNERFAFFLLFFSINR